MHSRSCLLNIVELSQHLPRDKDGALSPGILESSENLTLVPGLGLMFCIWEPLFCLICFAFTIVLVQTLGVAYVLFVLWIFLVLYAA